MGKVLSQRELVEALSTHKKENQKIVFTNGCFDILHVGHLRYLQEARALGDLLVVGMNTDASVKGLKGEARPIMHEEDRSELLAGLGCVDYVCLFNDETPFDLIKELNPNVLVKGGDWKPEQIVGSDIVLKNGGEVHSLKFHPGRSTTNIVERIQSLK